MELPPFAPVDAAAAARAIFRGEGGDEKEGGSNSTAIKWVRRCCPQLPASLVQKLFRLRKVKKNAVTAETSSADASTEQFRLKRVSAKDHLVLGDTLFLPVNIQESSVAEKTRKFDNRNEIEFLRSLEIHKGGVGIKNSIDVLAPMFEENSSDAPRLVHRLDRDCSGVLVLGRTQLSASILHAIFREKTADALADGTQQVLQRKYVALVMGTPRHPKGLLSAPLAKGGGSVAEEQPQLHLHCKQMMLPDISAAVQGLQSEDADRDFSDLEKLNFVAPLPVHMRLSWEVLKSPNK
ncbi:hypothetical protein ACQ4PT_052520 [Festuca glaucescens]